MDGMYIASHAPVFSGLVDGYYLDSVGLMIDFFVYRSCLNRSLGRVGSHCPPQKVHELTDLWFRLDEHLQEAILQMGRGDTPICTPVKNREDIPSLSCCSCRMFIATYPNYKRACPA